MKKILMITLMCIFASLCIYSTCIDDDSKCVVIEKKNKDIEVEFGSKSKLLMCNDPKDVIKTIKRKKFTKGEDVIKYLNTSWDWIADEAQPTFLPNGDKKWILYHKLDEYNNRR